MAGGLRWALAPQPAASESTDTTSFARSSNNARNARCRRPPTVTGSPSSCTSSGPRMENASAFTSVACSPNPPVFARAVRGGAPAFRRPSHSQVLLGGGELEDRRTQCRVPRVPPQLERERGQRRLRRARSRWPGASPRCREVCRRESTSTCRSRSAAARAGRGTSGPREARRVDELRLVLRRQPLEHDLGGRRDLVLRELGVRQSFHASKPRAISEP